MKIKKQTLVNIWKKEIKNMQPSPKRDAVKNLSFKKWLKVFGKDVCSSIDSMGSDIELSDPVLKLLEEWL